MIEALELVLDEAQEAELLNNVHEELTAALEVHAEREVRFAEFLRLYKSRPEREKKDFPWPGASNVVIPLVAATVDAIVARLQKTVMGTKDFCEVEIKSAMWEPMEKEIRDWINHYVMVSGVKQRLRTIAFDMALHGDSYAKGIWVEESRTYHKYDDSGNVVAFPVPGFTGCRWHIASPADIVFPSGFDEWGQLPWKANRLRFTWAELKQREAAGEYSKEALEKIKPHKKEREDPLYKAKMENAGLKTSSSTQRYEVYEIHGLWEVPGREAIGDAEAVEPTFEEVILTYSVDAKCFLRKIYNPYFGQQHMIVKIPFLYQAHEVQSMGVAEQVGPFQAEASTAHNQAIDAATASNAGIVVVSPESNVGEEEEIYPGKKIVTPNPDKDVRILHMNSPSPATQSIEERAAFHAEKRSGMSSYNLGLESSIVGSRATATGTTALISEGNIRQWVSIDDMRDSLVELVYLTIQMEQQCRPEGYEWAPGRTIKFPPGDVRTSLGLKLKVTSEQVNRELEVQNLQIMMAMLNDYYMRLSQAAMMIFNPQLPPESKLVAIQIMMASQNIVKRFVERFDVENVDMIVPNITSIIQGATSGPQAMAGAPAPGAGPNAPVPPGGPGQGVPGTPAGGGPAGTPPGAGPSALPA